MFGKKEHFVLKKNVAVKFSKKRFLTWKSDYGGHKSMMIVFLDQIFIIVMPIKQLMPKKKNCPTTLFWSLFVAEGGKYAKI